MDPKAFPASLDPKLKETYERVMGVNVKPQAGASPPPPSPQTPAAPGVAPSAQTGQQQDPAAQMTATPPPDFMDTAKQSQSSVAEPQAQQPSIILPVPPPSTTSAPPALQPQPLLPNSPLSTTPVLPSQPQEAAIAGMTAPAATTQVNITTQQLPAEQPQSVPKKKKSGLVKTLLLFLGFVAFFLVYALVWVKVFNLTLPFPLPF
ncbi:MAG: hypothetical protein HY430_02915 [Candidatus Levybacteria bacterium]|nr:hypothetical protein [Candidatus Levybacteria bacterium]